MPYIITTTRPATGADREAHIARCRAKGIAVAEFDHVATRRAVAAYNAAQEATA